MRNGGEELSEIRLVRHSNSYVGAIDAGLHFILRVREGKRRDRGDRGGGVDNLYALAGPDSNNQENNWQHERI